MGFLGKQFSKNQQPFYSEQNSWRNEINIYRIDDTLIKTFPTRPFKPHRNNYQAIIWFNAGSGTHLIDDQLYEIEGNTLVHEDVLYGLQTAFWILLPIIQLVSIAFFDNLTVNSVLS